jgi:hypothetical protein
VAFQGGVLRVTAAVLVAAFVVLYVAAKVHFFTRFGATDLNGYIGEHWPYSAGLGGIMALVWAISWLSRKIGVDTSEKDGPTAR